MAWHIVTRDTGLPEIIQFDDKDVRTGTGKAIVKVEGKGNFHISKGVKMYDNLDDAVVRWNVEVMRAISRLEGELKKYEGLLRDGPTVNVAGER